MFKREKNKKATQPVELTQEERFRQIEKVAAHIEKIRMGDYIDLMSRPLRIIWVNLLGGISRGVGLTIGATLVIAILFKILSALIAMNIPYLTDMLQEVVQIVKATPAGNGINIPNINVPINEPVVVPVSELGVETMQDTVVVTEE